MLHFPPRHEARVERRELKWKTSEAKLLINQLPLSFTFITICSFLLTPEMSLVSQSQGCRCYWNLILHKFSPGRHSFLQWSKNAFHPPEHLGLQIKTPYLWTFHSTQANLNTHPPLLEAQQMLESSPLGPTDTQLSFPKSPNSSNTLEDPYQNECAIFVCA